jgi:3-oxoacyl-[acyl-carrier protein] reductase|tara:strand:- start:3584 stop:4366 length:783 start_codon:yes stop_codon:yes gene_type:complete
MSITISLAGKVAIVTGGRRQLGAAQAIRLAECGADICIADIADDEFMAETCVAIEAIGRKVLTVVCDVSQREQIKAMVDTCVAELGRVDILVNNAGISSRETLMNVTDEEWDAVFDINLKGLVMCSQYAAKQMIAQGDGGAIVNLSSSTGLNANVSRGPYSVSKAGVIMATNLLAKELGEHSITVNALAPGFTSTAKIGGRDGQMFYRGAGETEKVLAKLALQRQGEPVDYANAVVYLASELGSYVTGTTIPVDGGFTIR